MADKLLSLQIICIIFALKVNMSICDDDDDVGNLVGIFSTFVGGPIKTQMSGKDWTKLFKDVLNRTNTFPANAATDVDIVFTKSKEKGVPYLIVNKENIKKILHNLAHALLKFKTSSSEEEIYKKFIIRIKKAKYNGSSNLKTDAADRLTDASEYTGSHKERFDSAGKGKGEGGRSDGLKNEESYLGSYKGNATDDKRQK